MCVCVGDFQVAFFHKVFCKHSVHPDLFTPWINRVYLCLESGKWTDLPEENLPPINYFEQYCAFFGSRCRLHGRNSSTCTVHEGINPGHHIWLIYDVLPASFDRYALASSPLLLNCCTPLFLTRGGQSTGNTSVWPSVVCWSKYLSILSSTVMSFPLFDTVVVSVMGSLPSWNQVKSCAEISVQSSTNCRS